jgi:hypothetical protein
MLLLMTMLPLYLSNSLVSASMFQVSNRGGHENFKDTLWGGGTKICLCCMVRTIFHPANRPIDFLKSFLFGFFINSIRVRVAVRVWVSYI